MGWKNLKKHEVDECQIGDRLACNNSITSFSGDVIQVVPGEGAWISNFYGRYFANPDHFQIKKWIEPALETN